MENKNKSVAKPVLDNSDKKLFLSVSLIILVAPLLVLAMLKFTKLDSRVIGFSVLGMIVAIKSVFVY